MAYYTLLSLVPLLGLIVIGLSHWIDQRELVMALGRYLEWLVPGQSRAMVTELKAFLQHRQVVGWVLLGVAALARDRRDRAAPRRAGHFGVRARGQGAARGGAENAAHGLEAGPMIASAA